jgi:hypothetical protein
LKSLLRFIGKTVTLPVLVVSCLVLFCTLGGAYLSCVVVLKILGSCIWQKPNRGDSPFLNMVGGERPSFETEIADMMRSAKKNTLGR